MDADLLPPPKLFIAADAPIYMQVEYSPGSWNISPQNKITGVDTIPPYQLVFAKRGSQTEHLAPNHSAPERELYDSKKTSHKKTAKLSNITEKSLQPAPKVIIDISKLDDNDLKDLYIIGVVDEQVYRLSEGQRFGILVSGVLNVKCSPELVRDANIHDRVFWNHKKAQQNWSTFPEFTTGEIELNKEENGHAIGKILNYANSTAYARIFFEVFYNRENYSRE